MIARDTLKVGDKVLYAATALHPYPAIVIEHTIRLGYPAILKIDVTAYGETFRIDAKRRELIALEETR